MENVIKKLRIERTKSGYPALWENGGSATNTGEATIIAGANGRRKKAIYIKRKGHLSNGNHALIVVEAGDVIVKSYHKRKDFWTRVFQIKSFDGEYAVAELIYEFRDGQWNCCPPASLQPAITAGMEKATCYHCRSAHWVEE